MANQLNNDIIRIVKQYDGVIVGSYALKIFNPSQVANDIDIISSNPSNLANNIAVMLNRKYKNNRFTIIRSYNAFRVYDNKSKRYVADVARYPISINDYIIVNGLKVATPSFVMRGKTKQQFGRKLFKAVRTPRVDIRKFL